MVRDDTTEYLRKIARRIIVTAIRDLRRGRLNEVAQYVNSDLFTLHLKYAGYPDELHDTLVDALVCSELHREKLCKEVERLLREFEETKRKPRPKPGSPRSIT